MPDELTDEEREFLTGWQNGLAGALGVHPTAVSEAHAAAHQAIVALTERYPSRTHRLLVLAALARECTQERDALLGEVLASRFQWTQTDSGEWRALAWQTWEERGLIALSGLSPTTIRRRIRETTQATLAAAKREAEKSASDAQP